MSKSKDDWYLSLKGWLPQWWFEQVENQEAVLYGMAAILERLGQAVDDHTKETYICQAQAAYLSEHGFERNLFRYDAELDPAFAIRIKNITNTTNCPAIKEIVDALLEVGFAEIREDFNGGPFFDREYFSDRGDILINAIINTFSIIVDRQVHAPYSFYSREYFVDREDFIGRNDSGLDLFNRIIESVNRNKALGTLYRLIERAG